MMDQLSLKESFECDICQKKFNSERHLKSHLLHHKVLSCDICEKVFSHPKNLKKHYKVHTNKKPHECEVCLKRFNKLSDLSKHGRTHSGKKEFSCHVCGKQFPSRNQLKKHATTHGHQKHFDCAVCLKIFWSLDQLSEHLSVHSTPKPFTCNQCPRQFSFKKNLVKHYQTHFVKCDKCPEEFPSKLELQRHRSVHRASKASLAKVNARGKKLSSLESLRIRNQICEETFECKECNKKYEHRRGFQRHLLIHQEKYFSCDVCNKRFHRKDHLQRHFRLHNGEKSYKCGKCPQVFFNLFNLRQHKHIHGTKKGSVRGKSQQALDSRKNLKNNNSSVENFPVPYVLVEKLKINDTDKSYSVPNDENYTCDQCNATFFSKWNLRRHSLIHRRKNIYRCRRCPEAFYDVDDLNKHKNIHTEKKVSVRGKFEEDSDSQGDFEHPHVSIEPDIGLEVLSESEHSDVRPEKKSKRYNYKHTIQKYFRMNHAGESFTCEVCEKKFHKKDIFKNHRLSHYNVKPYKCEECEKSFMYKSNLKQHMNLHGPEELRTSYLCKMCKKNFSTPYCLRRHIENQHREDSFVCNICQKVFANAERLKRHCNLFKGKEAYGCSECEKVFHYGHGLSRHLLCVHKKGTFECEECFEQFASQKSLLVHRDTLCGKESFRDESGLSKSSKPSLKGSNHLQENNRRDNNVCNICQKSFPNARLFKYHLDSYKGRQTYECTECVKKFHSRVSLNNHLRIHSTEQQKGGKSSNIRGTYENESSPHNHSTTDLEHQDRNNVCNICQKSFPNARLFKYHLDTYKGRQTYECSECVKKFHSRVSLNKHLRIHNAGSSQCDVCHKTFTDPVSLEQHIHVLKGGTSYECNIEDMFNGESIQNLIDRGLKELNPCTTENPCVIYISKEIENNS